MAQCPTCGKDVSVWGRDLISGMCNDCLKAEAQEQKRRERIAQERKRAEQEALLRTEEQQAAAWDAAREQRYRDRVSRIKQSILKRLEAGMPVIVYHSVYLTVDSVILDEPLNRQFDISALFQMGLQGWEAIQVVPRTIGVGLKNSSIGSTIGVTWGGGSGGNVTGVYVLLQKSLQASDVDEHADDELAKVIRSNLRTA